MLLTRLLQHPMQRKRLTFKWPEFKQKRDAYVHRLNGIYQKNLDKEKVDVDGNVEVQRRDNTTGVYSANHILVATGGKAIFPENIPGFELATDSDGFFRLEEQPKKVVVGAGYIGIELAGLFHGLGSETHLVIRGETVLRKFDECIQNTITDHYVKEGINVQNYPKLLRWRKT
ncbi:BFP_1a_G0003710.mRNA.1.CDS.1 [Saccharomyces cerevisiae]|nr:BFP_1a_G0003710.mRNA.1.CDS.1 [Saccharomyces cerevisiae]CAI7047362.1 BFP_1a_G0003710.mRNA.1.CDS.1 [Saccharomyces cerevisiae]